MCVRCKFPLKSGIGGQSLVIWRRSAPQAAVAHLLCMSTHSGVRVDCREDCAEQGDCFSLIKAGDTSGTVKQQAMAKQSLGPSSSYS